MESVHKTMVYKCDDCDLDKEFSKSGLYYHKQTVHKNKSTHNQCGICGKVLSGGIDKLKKHIASVHEGQKQYRQILIFELQKFHFFVHFNFLFFI